MRDRQRWLEGQREALEAAVNGASLETSLAILVRTAVEAVGGGARAGFYLANEDKTALHHVVGMPPEYALAVDGFEVGPDSLACGLATATGRAILTADVKADPLWREWLWLAETFDYRACWSFPVHTAGREFIGTLAVYSREPREATARDQEIGALLARTASIIIAKNRELQARQEAEDALRKSEMHYRLLVEQTPDGIFVADQGGSFVEVSPAGCAMLGMTRSEVLSSSFTDVLAPDEFARLPETIASFADGQVHRSEWRFKRKDGSHFWGEVVGRQLPDGRLQGILRDITERRQAETTRHTLLNELSHRVKNTLAIVQAIAQQTLARTRDPADFVASFSGRIQSLARVHSVLSQSAWQGADFHDLIRDQVLAGPVDETRFTARGPALQLDPQTALHLALMLHELGTNCCKYGALSVPTGRVTVTWHTDDALHVKWVERGGPLVAAPSRRGFGFKLIEQSARGMGGNAHMLCEGEGITWTIDLPLREVHQPESAKEALKDALSKVATAVESKPTDSLAGRRVLVVEDEPLVGMDIVAVLENAGAIVVGPVGSLDQAIETIERDVFDCALVDANLHGLPIDPVAAALTRRDVPFIFVTGYGQDGLPPSFRDVPILSKPFDRQQVLATALRLVSAPDDVIRLRRPGSRPSLAAGVGKLS